MRKILTLCLILCSTAVQARWATFADAPCEFLSSRADIMVYKDGTSVQEFEVKIKILNESGREAFASSPIVYTKDTAELNILHASITNGDQTIELDHESIEDKPIASQLKGFDQKHQVLIAVPNIQVGSVLHIKYVKKVFKPDLPGFFESNLQYVNQYFKQASVTFKSELPLYSNYNSPNQEMSVKHSKEKNLYVLNVSLNKPVYVSIVNEQQSNINPDKFPWVFVTTSNDLNKIHQQIAQPYYSTVAQPLPAMYEEIVTAVDQIEDPALQISTVMAMLNERVQYMGDWKSTDGRFTPQPLARVAQRRLGDCKDFAAGTAAILNRLGMRADVAIVHREPGIYYGERLTLPLMSIYNHAMVRVQHEKKVYWVDPTNFFSVANIIMPDIAERPALVCSEKAYLDSIPASTPQQNATSGTRTINLRDTSLVSIDGSYTLHGISAIEYTGAELLTSKETLVNHVLSDVGNYEYMQEQSVILPELNSRIVEDLTFKYKFKEKDYVSLSNAGKVVNLTDTMRIAGKFIFSPDQVSDIYLGPPRRGVKVYNFTNIKTPSDSLSLDAELKSPWLDISRKVTYNENSVQVKFEYQIKKSWLSRKVIRSKEYQKMTDKLSKQFANGISLVFN